jgi:hypothetical protein
MKTVTTITRIHNPEVVEELPVQVYEEISEAIVNLGATEVLKIINDHCIRVARYAWRETTI